MLTPYQFKKLIQKLQSFTMKDNTTFKYYKTIIDVSSPSWQQNNIHQFITIYDKDKKTIHINFMLDYGNQKAYILPYGKENPSIMQKLLNSALNYQYGRRNTWQINIIQPL